MWQDVVLVINTEIFKLFLSILFNLNACIFFSSKVKKLFSEPFSFVIKNDLILCRMCDS